MTAIRLDVFGGIAPRFSRRLLPQQAATVANNCKLLSGELRAYRYPRLVQRFTPPIQKAYRIPSGQTDVFTPSPSDKWLTYTSRDVNIVRSPIINDQYSRYYISGDGALKYTSLGRIQANESPLRLGVPTPIAAPSVSPPIVGATPETRAYVYTFYSAYGEEGPPSPPTLAAGDTTGTWSLAGMDISVPNSGERAITHKRIYRTVPGKLSTSFFFVASVPIAQSTYTDTSASTVVASNPLLESTTWVAPPETLQGIVAMPNGFLVGFLGRDLYFSEPYRPHAWPAEYGLSVEYPIIGLAVHNSLLVILTESNPYVGTGVNPAGITLQKLNAVEPCLSKASIVTNLTGVYYTSPNGLVHIDSSGIRVITTGLMTKEEWQRQFNFSNVFAGTTGLDYVGYDSPDTGFIFQPTEDLARLTRLDRFTAVSGLEVDAYSGELYVIQNGAVQAWDPPGTEPQYFTWKSKEFVFPKPLNFGAAKIKFDTSTDDVSEDIEERYSGFNEQRITQPLNAIALTPVAGVRKMAVTDWDEPQNRSPVGGSPLYPYTLPTPGVRLTVYAHGVEVFSTVVYEEFLIRLPTGFKSDLWQFELVGNTPVYSLVVGETSKELRTV